MERRRLRWWSGVWMEGGRIEKREKEGEGVEVARCSEKGGGWRSVMITGQGRRKRR